MPTYGPTDKSCSTPSLHQTAAVSGLIFLAIGHGTQSFDICVNKYREERTSFTERKGVLVKVIDEHDVAVYIANF